MRDVRDWNKYVDMVGKAVSKRAAVPAVPSVQAETVTPGPDAAEASANGGRSRPTTSDAAIPTRKGRGPRKEETLEELLARLTDPTLTLEETARILEVCPTTVRRYTNKGVLPHERSAGNQRRFKLSRVLAFRDAQRRNEPGEETAAE